MFARRAWLWVGACAAVVVSGVHALTKGHDLSSAPLMEKEQGTIWYDTTGKQAAIEDILGKGGMDSVRLRLWTGEEYGLNYTLTLAQRFSKKGYKIFLDLHFSDTWAQPSDQQTPSAWDNSSVETLASACRDHVSSTLKAFTEGGVELDILSIGNEITDGFLYPTGKISNDDFGPFAKLWKAARDGVTDAVQTGTTRPKVMIHLDNGWKYETVSWFFKGLFAEGSVTIDDVDAFGFSFYPYYNVNATLDALTSSLTQMANTYKKPIYVAETDWPTNCTTVTLSEKYRVSARGQREWVMAIMDVLEGLPNGLGAGIFYWEPGYISVPGLGSACGSNLLFNVNWDNWPDTYANALSSVYMFADRGSSQGGNGSATQSATTSTTAPIPQVQTDSSQPTQLNFSQLDQTSSSTKQTEDDSTQQTSEGSTKRQ
ncbi:putative beta-galactosidase [Phytophthora palmivora]|uniref:arabinogalactan endo-beta-1,4-galactanase n=1 Tax=Phytophthora palmivora TaxID=4796 RepID=A0A2P4X7V0_9STRA|nr:putative beta-galactosidase [Phytophthora palmivora]